MKINVSKEWCLKMAQMEEGYVIEAGSILPISEEKPKEVKNEQTIINAGRIGGVIMVFGILFDSLILPYFTNIPYDMHSRYFIKDFICGFVGAYLMTSFKQNKT